MKKLTKLITEVLRVSEEAVTDELSITNTDTWDSLKHMELIVAIEEMFAVKLTADEIVCMVNIREIKRILKDKGAEL